MSSLLYLIILVSSPFFTKAAAVRPIHFSPPTNNPVYIPGIGHSTASSYVPAGGDSLMLPKAPGGSGDGLMAQRKQPHGPIPSPAATTFPVETASCSPGPEGHWAPHHRPIPGRRRRSRKLCLHHLPRPFHASQEVTSAYVVEREPPSKPSPPTCRPRC